MNLLALRTENYFFNAKSLNLTVSKNINFYFQIRMFWLSQQNTPTLDTVYIFGIKKSKGNGPVFDAHLYSRVDKHCCSYML